MTETEYAIAQTGYAEDVERMGRLKAELERYESTKRIIADLDAEVSKLSGEISGISAGIAAKEKQIAALPGESAGRADKAKTDIGNAEKELSELGIPDTVIQNLESRIAGIEVQRIGSFNSEELAAAQGELSKAGRRIQALEGVCPTCGQTKPKTVETEKELLGLKKKVPELETRIAGLKAESERIAKLQKESQENKELRTKLEHEKQLLIERRDTRKREAETSLANAKAALDTEKSNLERLLASAASALAETRKLLDMKKSSKADADKRLGSAKAETVINPGDELITVQREIAGKKARIDEYQRILTEREAVIRQREQLKKQKEEDTKRIKILDTELQGKSREVAEIENSVKILKNEFPVYVISHIVKDLEVSMNDFLRRVYGGKYTIKLEDKKNSLRMVYGPKNADAGSGLSSGYEKSIFSLAWKWALSKVQNNRALMMDEVDSAASQKNSLVFYKTIGDSMKLFDQILIVSHKEQTRELLENEYDAQVLTFTDGLAV
jgi:DNA repair exonuclease SbcCD ATPase subunit